jgi:hypothetical protein
MVYINVVPVNGLKLTIHVSVKINTLIWFYVTIQNNVNVKQIYLFDFIGLCKTW